MATRSKMKSQYRKENADRRPHATAKHIRISSRKVKIVIDLIRGKSVEDAEAVNNLDMDKETLYVAECFANQGPTLRRYRPRSRGSASRIRKRTSHITIILDEKK